MKSRPTWALHQSSIHRCRHHCHWSTRARDCTRGSLRSLIARCNLLLASIQYQTPLELFSQQLQGRSVVKMVKAVIGPELLRQSFIVSTNDQCYKKFFLFKILFLNQFLLKNGNVFQLYLQKNAFNSARHTEWIEALNVISINANITDWDRQPMHFETFLSPWLFQQGYPIVTTTRNDTHLTMCQEPNFNLDDLPDNKYGYKWHLPLLINHIPNGNDLSPTSDNGAAIHLWLTPNSSAFRPMLHINSAYIQYHL